MRGLRCFGCSLFGNNRLNTFFFTCALLDGAKIWNDLNLSVDLESVNVALQIMASFLESSVYTFPLGNLFQYPCWLAAMPKPQLDEYGRRQMGTEPSAALIDFVATIQHLKLTLSCVSCSGPKFLELSNILGQSQKATAAATDLLDFVTERIIKGEFLQFLLDQWIHDANRSCPHSPTYYSWENATAYQPFEKVNEFDNISFLKTIGTVMVAVLLIFVILFFVLHFSVQRQHNRWISTVSEQQALFLIRQQQADEQNEANINELTRYSMFSHPDVPIVVRLAMPVIIVGNIGLFLSGHLSKGATVIIDAQIGGESFRVEDFFTFSMARSTIEIWNAGGRELAIMILLSSVIWPYTKQLVSLVAWFLPPSVLPIAKRGSIFLWLDRMAKWSIADVFVLVITLAAFR
jgi:hypothetical protein